MTIIRMFRGFFAANRSICRKIEPYLPQAKTDLYDLYERVVAQYMNSRADQTIVDVGGGKSCPFAEYRDAAQKARIIAVDISEEELKHNTDVDEKRVANVLQGLPLGTEEADLITSRLVLEHLESLDGFVANSRQALKRGGYFIHLFPCKYAPFALINQTLPHALSTKVLYFFQPEERGISGFSAFYDNCYYSGISKLLRQYDFEVVDIHPSYYQSPYFNFFVPLFLVSALYEALIRTLQMKNLCAYLLLIARKR
jgi:SAM-dependent methyltransferase